MYQSPPPSRERKPRRLLAIAVTIGAFSVMAGLVLLGIPLGFVLLSSLILFGWWLFSDSLPPTDPSSQE